MVHSGERSFNPLWVMYAVGEEVVAHPRIVDLATDDAIELDPGRRHPGAGGRYPRKLPRWVPRAVQRVATISLSAIWSSMTKQASG